MRDRLVSGLFIWFAISVSAMGAGPSTTLANLPNTGITAVSVDSSGNIYIAGFQGTVAPPDTGTAFMPS